MNLNTKLFLFLQNFSTHLKKKIMYFRVFFANGIFFLFIGFLAGNLFGSLLNIFHESIIWDGFITLIIVLLVELISYLIYHSNKRTGFFLFNLTNFNGKARVKKKTIFNQIVFFLIQCFQKCVFLIKNGIFNKKNYSLYNIFYIIKNFSTQFYLNKVFFLKNLNLFKIGILLGFFIDAFKVGS